MSERLQKFLANIGIGSRRKIELLINEGRIKVNGKIAELGCKVDQDSEIFVDNKKIIIAKSKELSTKKLSENKQKVKLLIYHKPVGKICTNDDPENRETVFSDLPVLQNSRWISIGRLDLNTSGLLLFTTDGEFANKLMHPRYNHEREYLVRVLGSLDSITIKKLLAGIELEDGLAQFKSIIRHNSNSDFQASNNWYRVVLTEGRNRVVRRLFDAVGCKVNRLIRIRFGNYKLPLDLKPGCYTIINDFLE